MPNLFSVQHIYNNL